MPVSRSKSRLTDGLRLYAIGDVHGCDLEMRAMLYMIDKDRAANPVERAGIVFLGDYIDRGPQSKGVIHHLMHLTESDSSVLCLCGNHDAALGDFLADPTQCGEHFFSNGGVATLRSFGVAVPKEVSTLADYEKIAAYARLLIMPSHLAWLESLPHGMEHGDYFFCHAGIRPGVALEDQTAEDLTWIRHEFLQHTKPLEKVVVHGHTPVAAVEFHDNRIAVDTKCCVSGTLSCVVLEKDDQRVLTVNLH